MSFIGTSTRGLYGASKGNECVAALQKILANAGIFTIGVNKNVDLRVSTFTYDAEHEGYSTTTNPQPVDLVNLSNDHMGVCITAGCSEMVSNRSSTGIFSYEDTPSDENAEITSDDGDPVGPITYLHHN